MTGCFPSLTCHFGHFESCARRWSMRGVCEPSQEHFSECVLFSRGRECVSIAVWLVPLAERVGDACCVPCGCDAELHLQAFKAEAGRQGTRARGRQRRRRETETDINTKHTDGVLRGRAFRTKRMCSRMFQEERKKTTPGSKKVQHTRRPHICAELEAAQAKATDGLENRLCESHVGEPSSGDNQRPG